MKSNKFDEQLRDSCGKFTAEEESRIENLNVRVSKGLKQRVKAVSGDRTADWLREAVLEKLAREEAGVA